MHEHINSLLKEYLGTVEEVLPKTDIYNHNEPYPIGKNLLWNTQDNFVKHSLCHCAY